MDARNPLDPTLSVHEASRRRGRRAGLLSIVVMLSLVIAGVAAVAVYPEPVRQLAEQIIAYGRGLRLNPAALLVGLIFFWGLWGVAGAFLAVPILAAVQVVAMRVRSLHPIAVFLGE